MKPLLNSALRSSDKEGKPLVFFVGERVEAENSLGGIPPLDRCPFSVLLHAHPKAQTDGINAGKTNLTDRERFRMGSFRNESLRTAMRPMPPPTRNE